MIKIYTLLITLFTASGIYAQTSTLLKDINPGTGYADFKNPKIIGNKMYFAADDGTHGLEPWVSDGTPEGTYMLKDINPGSAGSDPKEFTLYNNNIYFAATEPTLGRELWMTNNTQSGTQLFMDIYPGAGSGNPLQFKDGLGLLFFQANNGVNGAEAWKTNGTINGTSMIIDFTPGNIDGFPINFKEYNGRMYFQANTEVAGIEPCYTDGTPEGTGILKDIAPGATEVGGMGSPTIYNGLLYFVGNTQGIGYELWVTDGTEEGTERILDLGNGDISGLAPTSGMYVYNEELYFAGAVETEYDWQLWKSDGTEQGTAQVSNFTGVDGETPPYMGDAFVFNNLLYFRKAVSLGAGVILWSSDGTEDGTIKAVTPIPALFNRVNFCSVLGNSIYYLDYIPSTIDLVIWKSDGTAAGAEMIPLPENSFPAPFNLSSAWMGLLGGKIIYYAMHDMSKGFELYILDAGTVVSLSENKNDKNIKLYPNPANDRVQIVLPQFGNVTIYNAMGTLIESVTMNTNHTLDVRHYAPGIYIAKVQDEVVRFIKE